MISFKHLCICLFLFISGCAANTQMVSLSEPEESLAREAFKETVAQQKKCMPWVDAEVNVTLDSFLSSGSFDGYIQAMTPSYLKFVGTNPFGQPLLAFTSGGGNFQYVSYSEKRYFEGDVTAKAVSRFAPSGFELTDGFYWLIGRIAPGGLSVVEAGGDAQERGSWVELVDNENEKKSRVLFDPVRKIILEHILLDSTGGIVMKAEYGNHLPGDCGLPSIIKITGDEYKGSLVLRLADWQADTPFNPEEFILEPPAGFKRVEIK